LACAFVGRLLRSRLLLRRTGLLAGGLLCSGLLRRSLLRGLLGALLRRFFGSSPMSPSWVLVRTDVADRPEATPSCLGFEASSRPTIPHFHRKQGRFQREKSAFGVD